MRLHFLLVLVASWLHQAEAQSSASLGSSSESVRILPSGASSSSIVRSNSTANATSHSASNRSSLVDKITSALPILSRSSSTNTTSRPRVVPHSSGVVDRSNSTTLSPSKSAPSSSNSNLSSLISKITESLPPLTQISSVSSAVAKNSSTPNLAPKTSSSVSRSVSSSAASSSASAPATTSALPFATQTVSIPGLTANSVTSTTIDGQATVLPIWVAALGVGIVVVPAVPGVPIIPAPAGLPSLSVGSNGKLDDPELPDDPSAPSSGPPSSAPSASSSGSPSSSSLRSSSQSSTPASSSSASSSSAISSSSSTRQSSSSTPPAASNTTSSAAPTGTGDPTCLFQKRSLDVRDMAPIRLLSKRDEATLIVPNPLSHAINMLSGTSSGRGSELITPGMTMIRNSDNLGLVRTSIPTWAESFWINGLRGKIDLAANNIKLPVPDASPRPITFERETVTWTIRWDFDPTKGLHVNVDISGRGRRAKFALQPNFAAGMTVTHLSEVCDWVLTIDRTKQPPTSAPSEWTRSIPPKTDGSPGKDYWITPAFRARTTESEAIQKALNLWEATMACPLN